ncbi:hypothetical protein [Rubritalea tangerina]|uniref:Glycosyl transferase family 1 domain-containing protein n=1 Tax=Rubritalea tangerina TaxID=430798 RepID=A0ABW4ZCX6_9BACT
MHSSQHILCIAFYIEGTGLTRVISELIAQFKNSHNVHLLGVGYQGPVIKQGNCTIYPTNLNGGDIMAAHAAHAMVLDLEPEYVFILHDAWHFQRYMAVFSDIRHLSSYIGYVPIDGEVVDPNSVEPLTHLDNLVLYTEWARNQVSQAMLKIAPEEKLPKTTVIGHGVDLKTFYPLPNKVEAKAAVFPNEPSESFIILNASRPCIRKRIDITLQAFAAFAKNKPSYVKLCLHQAISEAQSSELQSLINQLNIAPRILHNPLSKKHGNVLSDSQLNLLYNACDIGVNSSMGEGWGLISFEHAATGAAQIVPNHTACGPLWKNAAHLLPCENSNIGQISPFIMQQPTVNSLTAAFEKLYQDTKYRNSIASQCLKTSHQHPWATINQQWQNLLKEQSLTPLP